MRPPLAKTPIWQRLASLLLRRGLIAVVLAFAWLQYWSKTSMKKTDFTQVRLSACSSGFKSEHNHSCLVKDPSKPTSASLVAERDHEILYFDLAAKRKFSRTYRDTRHYRLEFKGSLACDGGSATPFESAEEVDAEGATVAWEVSFPRRIVWAKGLKKGQRLTVHLDYLRVYADRKSSEFADDFASAGIIEFAILAESDTNWLLQRIHSIKAVASVSVLSILAWVVLLSETGRIATVRAVTLALLGLVFLAANNPFSDTAANNTPEEYFSNQTQAQLNYLAFTSFEVLMGFQSVSESFAAHTAAKRCLTWALGIGYLIAAYVRHAHISDFKDAANTYSDGEARVFRQAYFKTLTQKAVLISSLPCLLTSLFAALFGKGFSPVSAFIGYMILAYTPERHVLATFCSWKYARDLAVWVLGYWYLAAWTDATDHQPPKHSEPIELEDERLPITTPK